MYKSREKSGWQVSRHLYDITISNSTFIGTKPGSEYFDSLGSPEIKNKIRIQKEKGSLGN
jgi:hypothetical protein